MTQDTQMLKRSEVAQVLRVSLSTVEKLMKREEHPIPYIRFQRRILVRRTDLDRWIEEEVRG